MHFVIPNVLFCVFLNAVVKHRIKLLPQVRCSESPPCSNLIRGKPLLLPLPSLKLCLQVIQCPKGIAHVLVTWEIDCWSPAEVDGGPHSDME